MDTCQRIVLIFMVITTSKCSETAEPPCEGSFLETFKLPEAEAFYFVPLVLLDGDLPNEEFTWYKGSSQISTDKNERVHSDGEALIFLDLLTDDSGFYSARHIDPSGYCSNYPVKIDILRNNIPSFGEINNSDVTKEIPCPDHVSNTCDIMKGEYTWYKDSKLLQGHSQSLWIYDSTKDDEGLYTCICTWTYNLKVYNSSASRRLKFQESAAYHPPQIISPTNKEQLADEGSGIKLNCSVFFGTNVKRDSYAIWYVNGEPFDQTDGYNQTTKTVIEGTSKTTISTAILTIGKVSAKDFQAEYKCLGVGLYETVTYTITLKRRESIIPLVIGGLCVFFFCVLVAALVKCFAIDIALFFRPYLPLRTPNKDMRVYDAYVAYQMQSMDKVTEDSLCQFITKNLPSVLEEKCGYRLFIHGRDDMPGEDRVELVENRMKQSRRLIVILTPSSESGAEITDLQPAQTSLIGGFDCQVGLHHALVQREINVILIQLGEIGPQGYTHFPPGLQHLIHKSAPIKWPEGSRDAAAWNSRFWKKVRYLMPATPARKCPQSAII